MIETKKFIFLSRRQRHSVSSLLALLLVGSIGLLISSKVWAPDPELKLLSIDLIKITVTAWGAWGLILLYASSNSFERIAQETENFLVKDLPRAFTTSAQNVGRVAIDPLNQGLRLNLIVQTRNSVIYEFMSGSGFAIHFYCKLNVHDLSILVYLPAHHATDHAQIYQTSLDYLKDNGIKHNVMGVFEARWLPDHRQNFQIQILRTMGDDFLFDAAKRSYAADLIFGDMRAFLLRAQREEMKQA